MSTVTEHGYVLIYVGKDHHLADVRGYAYEHRLVMEKKLGRKLLPSELVHHKNEDHADNKPSNLVLTTRRDHVRIHKPRLGTGSMICRRGHLKQVQPSGKVVCRVCINNTERNRYHGNKK